MHTYFDEETGQSFHYNSDFSGDVILSGCDRGHTGEPMVRADALLRFVAFCYVVPERVGRLEQETDARALLVGKEQG